MNFDDIEKQINELKDVMPTPSKNKEGETCIHGNSWNSGCSDCDENFSNMNAINVLELVEKYKSDAGLGKAIRKIYKDYINDSNKTKE